MAKTIKDLQKEINKLQDVIGDFEEMVSNLEEKLIDKNRKIAKLEKIKQAAQSWRKDGIARKVPADNPILQIINIVLDEILKGNGSER